jgi:hypothetical protein
MKSTSFTSNSVILLKVDVIRSGQFGSIKDTHFPEEVRHVEVTPTAIAPATGHEGGFLIHPRSDLS